MVKHVQQVPVLKQKNRRRLAYFSCQHFCHRRAGDVKLVATWALFSAVCFYTGPFDWTGLIRGDSQQS